MVFHCKDAVRSRLCASHKSAQMRQASCCIISMRPRIRSLKDALMPLSERNVLVIYVVHSNADLDVARDVHSKQCHMSILLLHFFTKWFTCFS